MGKIQVKAARGGISTKESFPLRQRTAVQQTSQTRLKQRHDLDKFVKKQKIQLTAAPNDDADQFNDYSEDEDGDDYLVAGGEQEQIEAAEYESEDGSDLNDAAESDDEDGSTEALKAKGVKRQLDDVADSASDDDDEDDSEDDTEQLLLELEKIKQEKARQKAQQQQSSSSGTQNVQNGAPNLKRRWNDDTVFRNQAPPRTSGQQQQSSFNNASRPAAVVDSNDILKTDFHKKFMNRYFK
ncbi:hypothetical protein MIR68_009540 [Amoeboaphelidium protococcarum]|nr:hypothetical protein MIR68_009540 [Amoeboaphelidium protococcarum]